MNKEIYSALEKSILHWEDMLLWAIKENPDERIIRGYTIFSKTMHYRLNTDWSGLHCPLCKVIKPLEFGCYKCPIYLHGKHCGKRGSLWDRVNNSKTWKEWIPRAEKMLKFMRSIIAKETMDE